MRKCTPEPGCGMFQREGKCYHTGYKPLPYETPPPPPPTILAAYQRRKEFMQHPIVAKHERDQDWPS